MLNNPGIEIPSLEDVALALFILVFHPHCLGPWDLSEDPRKGKTALFFHHDVRRAPKDARI
jgi:hypothetical protein